MPGQKKEFFIELVLKHVQIIYKICDLYADKEDQEDLKQEIIYQLWKSYPSFRGDSKFQTWMYRVALNTALLGLRANKIKYKELTDKELQIPNELDDEKPKQIQLLYHQIARLRDLDKTVLFLYLEGCSYLEIAEILGLSKSNVGVRLTRIKEKLRKMIIDQK